MERSDLALFLLIVGGVGAFCIGIIHYILSVMAYSGWSWDIRLAILGLLVMITGIIFSKIWAKVDV